MVYLDALQSRFFREIQAAHTDFHSQTQMPHFPLLHSEQQCFLLTTGQGSKALQEKKFLKLEDTWDLFPVPHLYIQKRFQMVYVTGYSNSAQEK